MSEINATGRAPGEGAQPPKQMAWDQRIARWLVRPLAYTPVHPNHITTVRLVLGLAACGLFAIGTVPEIHWAAGLFVLSNFVDHMDGELARLTGRTSRFGHYYDITCDVVIHVLLFVAIGFGLRDSWLGDYAMLLGVISGFTVSALFFTYQLIEARTGEHHARQPQFKGFHIEDTMYFIGPIAWCGGLIVLLVGGAIVGPLFLFWTLWRERAVIFGGASRYVS